MASTSATPRGNETHPAAGTILYVYYIVSKSCVCICQIMYRTSLVGQPLHKRGRVWCHAVVPALMQHLWICYKDLAPDWPVYTLGIAPAN